MTPVPDGLALDTIPKEEEGTIQTFMVGGRAVGLIATANHCWINCRKSVLECRLLYIGNLYTFPSSISTDDQRR
jgi:hypothetical protein